VNILILGEWDNSGGGYALKEAVEAHTDHVVRQACWNDSYLDYPVDVLNPDAQQLRELWEWSDVVNLHDNADKLLRSTLPGRPVFATYHGSEYRARWAYYNHLDKERGRISTALNLDLAMLGPRWLPRPMPDLSYMRNGKEPGQELHIVQAPTNRAIKNTQDVIDALGELDGVKLEIIEGVSNAECLQRKARADAMIGEFHLGYGTSDVECWAMGMAVIGNANPSLAAFMQSRLGELPYIPAPIEELQETVIWLRDNRHELEIAAQRGRAYWKEHHDPERVARQFIAICEEATGED
jgi:hypothetical protein